MPTSGNDANGIQYWQPLTAEGYTIDYSDDVYTYTKNFRPDGSMRSNFVGHPFASVAIMGYFKVVGASPATDGEEVSAQLNGGPHTSNGTSGDFHEPNDTWADVMDLGITNFLGTTSRVRQEKTHPTYTGTFTPTVENLPITDIRGVWRGFAGFKVNLDTNADGRWDKIAVIGAVDTGGLTGGVYTGAPVNTWVITYKRLFTLTELDLKSVLRPYVSKICHPEAGEQTIRIDQQVEADWISTNPAVQPYKHTTLKRVRQV